MVGSFRVGVVALVLAAAAGCRSESQPEPGSIAYMSVPGDIAQIDVMDADGTNQRRVRRTGGSDAPSWSPDGSQIAFSYGALDCLVLPACAQICIVNVDGTDRRCITPGQARSESPAWSPDGDEIAFVRWDYSAAGEFDIETDIYVIRAGGTDERPIAVAPGEDDDPEWSPDGEQIAFSSDRDDPERRDFDLYVMNANGSDVSVLTNSDVSDYWPDWSPDGKQILFTRSGRSEGDFFDIWVMNSDGSDQRILSRTPLAESQATWSPDGLQIAFVCEVEDTGSFEICLMNADGTGRRVVTHYAEGIDGTADPDWAPLVTQRD